MSCAAADLLASAIGNGYDRLSERQLLEVIVSGACAINGGGGGGGSQDMQVAWAPTNVKLGEEILFGSFFSGGLAGITSITFNQATSVNGFDLESSPDLTSLSFPNLVSIDLTNNSGYLQVSGMSALTTLSLPVFAHAGSTVAINSNIALVSLSLPALIDTAETLSIRNNSALASLSLAQFVSPLSGNVNFSGNSSLVTLTLTAFSPADGRSIDVSGAALNAASVNAILHSCVLQPTWGNTFESLDLSGGTSAAPSGAGIADKTTLIGRGATVNTN